MADTEIVQKVRGGGKDCYEVLIRRHTQALYRVGRMFDFDLRDIEDLIDDTHVEALRALGKYNPLTPFRTWLTRIMIDKCSLKVEQSYSAGHPDSIEPFSKNARAGNMPDGCVTIESKRAVDADLKMRSIPSPRFFVLPEVGGFSEKDTASLLNLSEDCVKKDTSHAKLSVKKNLRKNFFGETVYPFGAGSCERVVRSVMARI